MGLTLDYQMFDEDDQMGYGLECSPVRDQWKQPRDVHEKRDIMVLSWQKQK